MTEAAGALLALSSEIADDLRAIEKLVQQIDALRQRVGDAPAPPVQEVMAAAAFLHHVFTGMESIHERIVVVLDGASPSGDRWHQELLTRVSVELPGVRPAVLREETRAHLGRLLRFRHFFRHAYRIDLLWTEIRALVVDVPLIAALHAEDIGRLRTHLLAAASG